MNQGVNNNKVYPTNQNILTNQPLRNDTIKVVNNNNMGNPSVNRHDLFIETNTNNQNLNNNAGNTNMQLSPTSNKSYLKISGYNTIEQLKKKFLTTIDSVSATRLVEVLGGLAPIEQKKQALLDFSIIWNQLLDNLTGIQDNISLMSFESDIVLPNSDQFISDLIISNIKEIENQYLELIQNSSIRFLDTVCTVHDLQYKNIINLRYDIRSWKKTNIDHIKSTQPNNRKFNSLSTSYDKDTQKSTKQKSLLATLCGCCLDSREQALQNLTRQQSTQQIKR